MAELLQDAAAALLPPPPAGVALTLLLLELSLAHPTSPALAAIAATVICLIPALLVRLQDQENYYPERAGRVPRRPGLRPRGQPRSPAPLRPVSPRPCVPSPAAPVPAGARPRLGRCAVGPVLT